MASFIPSYIQKRLLRYALTRLDLLDHDALDLEKLDIALGKRSTVELRDIGLRLPKLTSLLHLPNRLQLVRARILRLRLTVPADIYSKGIVVEVDGVVVQINILERPPESRKKTEKSQHGSGSDNDKGKPGKRLGSPPVPARRERVAAQFSDSEDEDDDHIPTTQDLAKSFLEVEPQEEREELEAAINTQSQRLSESSASSSESSGGEYELGTGTELSLPGFLSGFLKGIKDRLEVHIKDVEITVNFGLPRKDKLETNVSNQIPATISFRVAHMGIEGLTKGTSEIKSKLGVYSGDSRSVLQNASRSSKRFVNLRNVCAYLITEETEFGKLAKHAHSPSVASRSSKVSAPPNHGTSTSSPRSPTSPSSPVPERATASSFVRNSQSSRGLQFSDNSSDGSPSVERLAASDLTADSDRFADPTDDGEPRTPVATSPIIAYAPSSTSPIDEHFTYPTRELPVEDSQTSDMWESYADNARSNLHEYVNDTNPNPAMASIVEGSVFEYSSSSHEQSDSMQQSDLISFGDDIRPDPEEESESSQALLQSSAALGSNALPGMNSSNRPQYPSENQAVASLSSDISTAETTPSIFGGMSESKIYSHEEAESMYMSAMTAASSQRADRLHLPGAWDSYSEPGDGRPQDTNSETQELSSNQAAISSTIIDDARCDTPKPTVHSPALQQHTNPETRETEHRMGSIQLADPFPSRAPALGSDGPNTSLQVDRRIAKEFFSIDMVSFWLPDPENDRLSEDTNPTPTQTVSESTYDTVPGSFSEYAGTALPQSRRSAFARRLSETPSRRPTLKDQATEKDEIDVEIGNVQARSDLATIQLLVEITTLLLSTLERPSSQDLKSQQRGRVVPNSSTRLKLDVNSISVLFLEQLYGFQWSSSSEAEVHAVAMEQQNATNVIVKCTVQQFRSLMNLNMQSTTVEAGMAALTFGYSYDDIISFDDSARLRTSMRDLREPQVDAVSLAFTKTAGTTSVKVGTLPVHVNFDLQKLDDTLSSFGGVSGILELSSSIMSNSTAISEPPPPPRPRGVHFASPSPDPEPEPSSTTKINIRLGGTLVEVKGKSCSVALQTSAIKASIRPQQGLFGLAVDEVRLSGPSSEGYEADDAVLLHVTNSRIDFLLTPADEDLERLISLLTPSRDKYENDDDILVDTLLRQRRKGSVIRANAARVEMVVARLDSLDGLQKLGDDMAKLSTVTKYLPEDDRPGILTLGRIDQLNAKVGINSVIGNIQVHLQNSQIAHVGLPSLVATEIGVIETWRNGNEILVQPVLPLAPSEQLPMVMARFLGGEIEPTVKVKLFNFCLEYRVPAVMAALGLQDGATTEEMITDLTASIATITHVPKVSSSPRGKGTGRLENSAKPLRLDVLLRDCALGLNPRNLLSKVLVVLTETKLISNLPGKENLKASINVRKASILMTDNSDGEDSFDERSSRRPGSAGLGSRQVTEICKRGYVSISFISSACAELRMLDNADGSQTADVELRDDLFVLETCADSTQTLIATLNDLQPPMPPSKDIKYRTQVMTMEDMMASFTGDAFEPVERVPEATEAPVDFDEGDLLDDEELPANLEYVGSFYNPDPAQTEEEAGDSMLEEAMQKLESPRPTQSIGALPVLDSFQEQYEVGTVTAPFGFDEDHFGSGSEIKGHAHKWNSVKNQLSSANEFKIRGSPLKVRARDIHIIWNLFDGYDWQDTRDTIAKTVKDVETRAEERRSRRRRSANVEEEDEESVIGDLLFNSIYIGIPANRDPKDLTRQINRNLDDMVSETESLATGTTTTVTATPRSPSHGRRTLGRGKRLKLERSKQHKITFELKGVSADMVVFPPGSGETQSSVDVRIREFEIFDHVPTSTWKKFMTYLYDAGEREVAKPMIRLKMLTVKPVAELAASEVVLKVTVLPLRLHVDQDALDFITRFFEFKAPSSTKNPNSKEDELFLQRVEVNTIQVRLDYKPKKIDYAGLRSGHTGEFMNFFILDGADFYLKHVILYGVLGFDRLHKMLNDVWMPDVRGKQLPGVLAGLAPVRGIVNVGAGVKDLVVVPMREYRKDGRVVRSIQKGAFAFAKTTTSELARLGARLAIGTQTALQGVEAMLSTPQSSHNESWDEAHLSSSDDDSSRPHSRSKKPAISAYADAPVNISSAIRSAAQTLERDLLTTRDVIIAIPGEVSEAEGLAGGAKAVAKRAPTILLRPAMGVAGAVGKVGLGLGNWVDPEGRRRQEREGKWKKY
ncbi:MAG: autophagy- protein 2 [Bogoriella megaspora]|nr:MAG: autophagy- protein 2 [Bogoriella megaspora]